MSLVEVLVVLAIMGLLGYVAVVSYLSSREQGLVRAAAEQIQFDLEAARADALAGRNNEPQGVKFNSDSYVVFSGSSYDAGESSNDTKTIDEYLSIVTTLDNDEVLTFAGLTGETGSTATITVFMTENESIFRHLFIGPRGT